MRSGVRGRVRGVCGPRLERGVRAVPKLRALPRAPGEERTSGGDGGGAVAAADDGGDAVAGEGVHLLRWIGEEVGVLRDDITSSEDKGKERELGRALGESWFSRSPWPSCPRWPSPQV